jgi:hypothetical protein
MTTSTNSKDSIDDYNESVWRKLGHPAFDYDYEAVVEDVEWWNAAEEGPSE